MARRIAGPNTYPDRLLIDTVLNTESARAVRLQNLRMLKDRIFGLSMAGGGIAVLIAILMIFFYLFWVVVPPSFTILGRGIFLAHIP